MPPAPRWRPATCSTTATCASSGCSDLRRSTPPDVGAMAIPGHCASARTGDDRRRHAGVGLPQRLRRDPPDLRRPSRHHRRVRVDDGDGGRRHPRLRERGFAVPDDVSLVALHDSELAGYLNPPLTTVSLPVRQMGSDAVDLLAELIDGGIPRSIVVDGEPVLIERAVRAAACERPHVKRLTNERHRMLDFGRHHGEGVRTNGVPRPHRGALAARRRRRRVRPPRHRRVRPGPRSWPPRHDRAPLANPWTPGQLRSVVRPRRQCASTQRSVRCHSSHGSTSRSSPSPSTRPIPCARQNEVAVNTTRLRIRQAVLQALHDELESDPDVIVHGRGHRRRRRGVQVHRGTARHVRARTASSTHRSARWASSAPPSGPPPPVSNRSSR